MSVGAFTSSVVMLKIVMVVIALFMNPHVNSTFPGCTTHHHSS